MYDPLTIDRAVTCCFTGHRSKDLPHGGDEQSLGMKNLRSLLYYKISNAVSDGYTTFISGMADGVDMICAEIVCDLINRGSGLRLICAVPYPAQVKEKRSAASVYMYKYLTERFPTVVLSEKYHQDCYRIRNKYMVDHSSRIIGACRKKRYGSGSAQTLRYARESGIECIIIDLDRSSELFGYY